MQSLSSYIPCLPKPHKSLQRLWLWLVLNRQMMSQTSSAVEELMRSEMRTTATSISSHSISMVSLHLYNIPPSYRRLRQVPNGNLRFHLRSFQSSLRCPRTGAGPDGSQPATPTSLSSQIVTVIVAGPAYPLLL
jgi:hypothetical protein